MRLLLSFIIIIALPVLSACSEDADSEDIKTSGIRAEIDVTSNSDNHAEINVAMRVGGSNSNTYIKLSGGDKLTATLNSSTLKNLDEITDALDNKKVTYNVTFNDTNSGANNASYKVSLERPTDTDALNSIVTVPDAATGFIADKNSFSRSTEDLSLTWDGLNDGSNVSLSYAGDCVRSDTVATTDDGSYQLNSGSIVSNSASNQNCDITFSLERQASGSLDSNFGEGGYIRAFKTTSIEVSSTP